MPCRLPPHPRIDDAVAAHDAQATAPKQRPKPIELQSVSSHAAAASAKSRSSAGHRQQSAADVAAAAGIAAAAAALQVIQSASEEVQAELQVFLSINSCVLAFFIATLLHVSCSPSCLARRAAAAATGARSVAIAAADAGAVSVAPTS